MPQAAVNMILGAYCGYGAVAKSNTFNAKHTVYEDNYDAAGTGRYAIPKNATNFLIYTMYGPGTLDAGVIGPGGQTLYDTQWTRAANQNVPVELTGDARYIYVGPGGLIPNGGTFRIVFGMSL